MNIVKETFKKWHEERSKEEMRKLIKELLMAAIKDGDSPKSIQRLIEKGNFNQDEIEEIYRQVEKH